jgi:uncharacterized membrane protein
VTHVPSDRRLASATASRRYDAVILSDYPSRMTPTASQRAIVEHAQAGRGLLMIGGWASFSGPLGRWGGTPVGKLLPVICRRGDDRLNLPTGALVRKAVAHPVLRGLSFLNPPSICGLNMVRPKPDSLTVLRAVPMRLRGSAVALEPPGYPLLVLDRRPRRRIAALMTDNAPHWCGGLVDWGCRCVMLSHGTPIETEVGDLYVRFLTNLLRWLCDAR